MRLFIAVLFDNKTEASIYESVERLRNSSDKGSFTRKENLHLTVNFIGETKRIAEVKQSMENAVMNTGAKSFFISIKGFGRFKRQEGDIYWLGVEREVTLWKLQKELVKELKAAGFIEIEEKEYTPHLTLGRRVKVKDTFVPKEFEESIKPLQMEVSGISLMKSEQLEGKLVYTQIYHIPII